MASADSSSEIVVEILGDIAIVSIDRPEKKNALTLTLWRNMMTIFRTLGSDRAIRAIILTGRGDSFCAGADISEFGSVRSTPQQIRAYEAVVDSCSAVISTVCQPTIAVIQGPCLGGGCSIALACDFRYAHPNAFIGIPAARLSIVYGTVGLHRLFALVGVSMAKYMLYSAERLDANQAQAVGLVDLVAGDPMEQARSFCGKLARNAPLTITAAKAVLNAIMVGEDIPEEMTDDLFARALNSWDYREGRTAFLEKRQPLFRGE